MLKKPLKQCNYQLKSMFSTPYLKLSRIFLKNPLSTKNVMLIACFCLLAFSGLAKEKIAILYVYPNDAASDAVYTKANLEKHMNGPIKKFWNEQSYGRYEYDLSVFVWKLPVGKNKTTAKNGHYVADMLSKVLPNGGNIKIAGYAPDQFQKTIILLGGGVFGFGGGFGSYDMKVNNKMYKKVKAGSFTYFHPKDKYFSPNLRFAYYDKGAVFKGNKNGKTIGYPEIGLIDEDGTLLHEWGHGIGLSTHANSWLSTQEPLYGDIYYWNEKSFWNQMNDYGNPFDIMGGNPQWSLHINAFYKELMDWIKPNEKTVVKASQKNIRIHPLESQTKGISKCAQYSIPAGQFTRPKPFDNKMDYAFYMEYRQPMGLDKHLSHDYFKSNTEGLLVYMTRRKGDGFINSWLLDMSPDNILLNKPPTDIANNTYPIKPDDHLASLNNGKAFYDAQTAFCITNIRPEGAKGILFDIEIGKKAGVASGVYTTTVFSGQKVGATVIDRLYSPNLAYYSTIKNNYWVVLKSSDNKQVWKHNVSMNELKFTNGELIGLKNGTQVWSSKTSGHAGSKLVLENNGQLKVYSKNGKIIWPTKKEKPTIQKEKPVVSRDADGALKNVALGKKARQSSEYNVGISGAEKAVDGNLDGRFKFNRQNSITHTKDEQNPWWEVDLGESYEISEIKIWNRFDCCWQRLQNFHITVSEQPITQNNTKQNLFVSGFQAFANANEKSKSFKGNKRGRFVRISMKVTGKNRPLSMTEVQVFGKNPQPSTSRITNIALGKKARQSSEYNAGISGAGKAVDGNTDGKFKFNRQNSVTHTQDENSAWWEVDLGDIYTLEKIVIWNREDCCWERLQNFVVLTSTVPFKKNRRNITFGDGLLVKNSDAWDRNKKNYTINVNETQQSNRARYIRISLVQKMKKRPLSLTEVQVFGSR